MALVTRGPNKPKEEDPIVIDESQTVIEVQCLTPWQNFVNSNIVPVRIKCQDYQPVMMQDSSCHTNLPLKAESMIGHMQPEHGTGGGFLLQLRHRPGQKWPGWQTLLDAKVELHDFRCDVCDAQLDLAPRKVIKHLQAHAGKSRQARPGGAFAMTLRFNHPDRDDEDENAWGDEG